MVRIVVGEQAQRQDVGRDGQRAQVGNAFGERAPDASVGPHVPARERSRQR